MLAETNTLLLFVPWVLSLFLLSLSPSDMPRQPCQRRLTANMDFFEGHAFHEGDNVVPAAVASVPTTVHHSGGKIADLVYQQSSFEPHVLSSRDGNVAPVVCANTSNGSLIGHVFHGGDNVVPAAVASVPATVDDSSGKDLVYQQSSFEPHVLSNRDGNVAPNEGTTVCGNTSDGSLIDMTSSRNSRKRRFEIGEGSSVSKISTTVKEFSDHCKTVCGENFTGEDGAFELETAEYLKEFPDHSGWWYISFPIKGCSREMKKRQDDDGFDCPEHEKQTNHIPCYRVFMTINDGTETTTLTLMGRQDEGFFGSTCQELLNKREYKGKKDFPEEILDKIGEIFVFEVKIKPNYDLVLKSVSEIEQQTKINAIDEEPFSATPEKNVEKKRATNTMGKTLFISEHEKKYKRESMELTSSTSKQVQTDKQKME